MKPTLDDAPARTDLTVRECTKIIGGLVGGLSQMAPIANVRDAVRWWADTDEAWSLMTSVHEANKNRTG